MKAIVVRAFGGPEQLRLEEAPDPVPSRGEVLVRVHAVSVNTTLALMQNPMDEPTFASSGQF